MKKIWFGLLATLAYNTAIAGLLTLLSAGNSFIHNFIFSQCIGFSVALINSLTLRRVPPGKKRWAAFCVSLPVSVVVGLTLAFWSTGVGGRGSPWPLQSALIALFFGVIASITFVLFQRIERLDLEIKQRQLDQMESEKRQLEAHLKLLQAQIEPHFLFNTLANVSSLIESDPALARRLLERLIDWLRIALARARSDSATLGDELDMLENYLQILQIRFGERLRWRIEVLADARQAAFPPMLLQPLVENAVRHGIELKVRGGNLHISAHADATRLTVSVRDDGAGFSDETKSGAGLENVRARLAALYGEKGKLMLESNTDGGLTATLTIPLCAR
jgi:LytS/YehU family sensor histidine kinase